MAETVYESDLVTYSVEEDDTGQLTIRGEFHTGNAVSLPVPSHVRKVLAEVL